MIYDKIDNIETYKGLSEDLRLGLEYLRNLPADVDVGVHPLSPRVKAVVSEYFTKEENENGYEAHRKFIDIQYLLSGREIVRCLPLEYLKQTKAYREEIDAAFYEECGVKGQELIIGNGYFAILFPQDGHKPCLIADKPEQVKKVVVKVEIVR